MRRQHQQAQLQERSLQKKIIEAERQYGPAVQQMILCVYGQCSDFVFGVRYRETRSQHEKLNSTTRRNKRKFETANEEVRATCLLRPYRSRTSAELIECIIIMSLG